MIRSPGSIKKKNALLNLKNYEPDTDNIFLYAKDSYEVKNQLLINKRESEDQKNVSDQKPVLNTHLIVMIFIKVLKNIIPVKNKKY